MMSRSSRQCARRVVSGVAIALTALVACGPAPSLRDPVVLIGVDGFEWSLILPLLHEGRLPTLARLMDGGTYGKLDTLNPAESPVIWTTVATGKDPTKHGIEGFSRPRTKGQRRGLYTSRDRRTKALWNILSDMGRSVHTIGWWVTFPAEPINGVMVAQTNTREQILPDGTRAPRKGTVLQGLPGQVTPVDLQNHVMDMAQEVDGSVQQLAARTYGEFSDALPAPTLRHWQQSLWSFRADNIYLRVAKHVLTESQDGPPDVLMVYFSMPDVVGHRFWRYAFPEEFEYPPSEEEIAGFSHVIDEAYVWVDRAIGEVLALYDEEATVFVVSDHGMRGVNRSRDFAGRESARSGAHEDGLPGVIIASGGQARSGTASRPSGADTPPTRSDALPVLGRVHDLAPTILTLQEVPVGRDMDGAVIEDVLRPEFLQRHPPSFVDTHDTDRWPLDRPDQSLTEGAESERLRQLRSLGYIR